MGLQQFFELADVEGPVTEACVSARDHTGGDNRWAKPMAANIWDKLAVVGQVAMCWTIQRLVYEQSQLKLDTSPQRQPVEPSQDWSDMIGVTMIY